MKLQVMRIRKVYSVVFPDNVSHTKLAKELGLSPQRVWAWIKRGQIPEEFFKQIKEVKIEDVARGK